MNPAPDSHSPAERREPGHPIFWDLPVVRWWPWLTAAYTLLVGGVLGLAIWCNFKLAEQSPGGRMAIVFGGLLVTLLPTGYWWTLSRYFESWADLNPLHLSADQLKFERDFFKANADWSKTLWAAVVATFVAFILTAR